MDTTHAFQVFSCRDLDGQSIYKIMTHTIVPRPIAWVTTLNDDDSINLAPFSFFNGVTGFPPTIMFSVARKPGGQVKDTHHNIEQRKEFVVNTVVYPAFEAMVDTAASYPYGVSEVEKMKLETLPSTSIKTPRIMQSAVQFECQLTQSVNVPYIGEPSATVFFGEILQIHVREGLLDEQGRMQIEKLEAVGRLGGNGYALLGKELHKDIPKAK